MIFKYEIIDDIPWALMSDCMDATIYKTKEWATFLKKTQKVKPYVIQIDNHERTIGWFYGEKISYFGISMVVSPLEGWTTSFQGLSLLYNVSSQERVIIYQSLIKWLFDTHQCLYFQVSDWQLKVEDVEKKLPFYTISGYRLDMTSDFEEEIYKKFKDKSAKYSIKKARKNGIYVKEATDIKCFVDHYYDQLLEVFAHQGLKPTYNKNRIIDLCESLRIGEQLLLLEAYLPLSEKCVATGLFLRHPRLAIYYGAASYKEYQNLCPNELLMYEAIKWIHNKGTFEMEFGGGKKYKEKYGPLPYDIPVIMAAKYSIIITMKKNAKKIYYGVRNLIAKLKK